MLFGTPQRLSRNKTPLKVFLRYQLINFTSTYKYLGIKLNNTVDTNLQFDSNYKRFSSRLNLLRRIRYLLDQKTTVMLYNTMLAPIFSYCSTLSLHLTNTQKQKLKSLESRASCIINTTDQQNPIKSIEANYKLRSSILVRKCIDKLTCSNFHDYFHLLSHEKHTRNNMNTLTLPKVRTEFGRKGFFFMGAKVYNELPLSIRMEKDFDKFSNLVKSFFT